MDYYLLDLAPQETGPQVIAGDICACPQLPDNRFDVIVSDNLFEHLAEPWLAAAEISRLLKPGGLSLTRTLFAWRYHPSPEDYFRYTHSGLKLLFERYGHLETVDCGYNLDSRRHNFLGGKEPGNRDGLPRDEYGGWLEGWMVYHAGRKPIRETMG